MEAGFGVTVDLSEWFSDARARCLVWVERRRRVRWLARRLRRRLVLRGPVALTSRAGLLLPGDPLALLQPGDTIRAIPMEDWFNDSISSEEESEEIKQTTTDASSYRPTQSPSSQQPAPSEDSCPTTTVCAVPEIMFPTPCPMSPTPRPVSLTPQPEPPECCKEETPSSPAGLELKKQQALALLEQLAQDEGGGAPPGQDGVGPGETGRQDGGGAGREPGRPRRRRVRRRPKHTQDQDTRPDVQEQEWCARSSSVESVVRNAPARLLVPPAPGVPAPGPLAPGPLAPAPRLVRAL